jgi:hypothetical protein
VDCEEVGFVKGDLVTVPMARRKDHVREAVRLMVIDVGDESTRDHCFRASDPRFSELLQTTWREMLDAGLTESAGVHLLYRLTPFGWYTGLRLTGMLESEELRERASKVAAALKGRVKGRHDVHDSLVDVRQLGIETGLPVGWLCNVFDADLLPKLFPKDRMNARMEKLLVRIPPTFGMDPLKMDD